MSRWSVKRFQFLGYDARVASGTRDLALEVWHGERKLVEQQFQISKQ